MTENELSAAAAIVRNIDLLEAAVAYVNETMARTLGREAAGVIDEKREGFGYAGEVQDDLNGYQWLAPPEWKAGSGDDDFDVFVTLEARGENDVSWVGTFVGAQNAVLVFTIWSDSVGRPRSDKLPAWKRMRQSIPEIAEELHARGFVWESDGHLMMPITILREDLAQAFENGDFTTALAPIAAALDRIHAARPVLDRLVERIRAQVE